MRGNVECRGDEVDERRSLSLQSRGQGANRWMPRALPADAVLVYSRLGVAVGGLLVGLPGSVVTGRDRWVAVVDPITRR
jgi:hypothetical protein